MESRPLWQMFAVFSTVALPVMAVVSVVARQAEPILGTLVACGIMVGTTALAEWWVEHD